MKKQIFLNRFNIFVELHTRKVHTKFQAPSMYNVWCPIVLDIRCIPLFARVYNVYQNCPNKCKFCTLLEIAVKVCTRILI